MSYACPLDPNGLPSWQRVLRDCGYPTAVLVLDFETYFGDGYGISDGSTVEYVNSPKFEVLGLGQLIMPRWLPQYCFAAGEQDVSRALCNWQSMYGENLGGCTVVGQNLQFDLTILSRRYDIRPPRVVDILGLARHWNSRQKNGLEYLCEQYGLIAKGDTENFKHLSLRRRYVAGKKGGPPVQLPPATPAQMQALGDYCTNDVLREWEMFTLLLPRLSNPKTELRLMQHTLELYTKPTIQLDAETGRDLMRAMYNELNLAVEATGHRREEISGNITYTGHLSAALEAAGDVPARYFKPCKTGYKLADAKTDPERELLLTHTDETVRTLAQARAAIKSWPLHIGRVESLIAQANADNGLLAIPLKYCGAHTQRWSGDGGVNPQNLGAKSHELINRVREMLIAPTGHTFAIVDASQIEARVLAWVAGQDDLVESFRKGEDVYCKFAGQVLGYRVRKPAKDARDCVSNRLRWARDSIGKVGILASGYGMGAEKLFAYAGGQIDRETAEKIKTTYRKTNAKIVTFWYAVENAFRYVCQYGKPVTLARRISFRRHPHADVVVVLPNGAELKYHKVRLHRDAIEVFNGLTKSWERVWGGLICENIVQSISRQILSEAILNSEDAGYHVALHSHDEIVCPVPVVQAPVALPALCDIMARVPAWAPGLPLSSEGRISAFYTK